MNHSDDASSSRSPRFFERDPIKMSKVCRILISLIFMLHLSPLYILTVSSEDTNEQYNRQYIVPTSFANKAQQRSSSGAGSQEGNGQKRFENREKFLANNSPSGSVSGQLKFSSQDALPEAAKVERSKFEPILVANQNSFSTKQKDFREFPFNYSIVNGLFTNHPSYRRSSSSSALIGTPKVQSNSLITRRQASTTASLGRSSEDAEQTWLGSWGQSKLSLPTIFQTLPLLVPPLIMLSELATKGADTGPNNSNSNKRDISLRSRIDSAMGWVERSVEHLPNFPRLHPQECVKRSICEAHYNPGKYGLTGLVLRFLFPATNLNITDKMDDMEYKVINKYRHAANHGLNNRLAANGTGMAASSACQEKYEDCLVSLLDVSQTLLDKFLN